MPLQVWRRLALPLVLAFSAVACSGGGAAQDPKDQLVDALRAMSQDQGVTVELSLDTDEASLAALSADDGGQLPPEAVAMLTQAALRVSLPLDPEAKSAELALEVAGEDLVALRMIDDTLYVQARAKELLEALGQDPAMLEGARAMLAQSGVLPPEVLDGRWVSLTGVTEMAEQFGGQGAANPMDQVKAREAMERFGRVLAEQAVVARVGEDADGDHLRADLPLRPLYEALLAEMQALNLPTPPGEAPPSPEDIPDERVAVDLWIRDGRLSVVSLDLRQMAKFDEAGTQIPAGVERFALRMRFTPFDGAVQAPADAVELDPQALMGLFMGAMAPAFGGSMGDMGMPPGFDPSAMPPGFSPPAGGGPGAYPGPPPAGEQAAAPDPVLVAFYGRPGYSQARTRYCSQVATMPEGAKARHYRDICPMV